MTIEQKVGELAGVASVNVDVAAKQAFIKYSPPATKAGIEALLTKIGHPPVREFLTLIHDSGCEIYGCKATVDMFHLTEKDFCPEVDAVITVGEFYEKSAGAQIIFT